jgi:glycolate oxidase iron-sulfur subunit
MLDKVPEKMPRRPDPIGAKTAVYAPSKPTVMRVALLAGCAQRALNPDINASTIRLLNRLGVEVKVYAETHCCGALAHHIGAVDAAHESVKIAVHHWHGALKERAIDAIVVNASGCGTMVKDYGHMMQHDQEWSAKAAAVSAATCDITELLDRLNWQAATTPETRQTAAETTLAYHSACSLQHGQKIHDLPLRLLRQAGFQVVQPRDGHLCCGSAGVYNLLQPELADGLKSRKTESLKATGAEVVAAGNIGCISQLNASDLPVRHTVELLDWVTGGEKPF